MLYVTRLTSVLILSRWRKKIMIKNRRHRKFSSSPWTFHFGCEEPGVWRQTYVQSPDSHSAPEWGSFPFCGLLLLFSHSVVSNSLQPWTTAWAPYPHCSQEACSNSCVGGMPWRSSHSVPLQNFYTLILALRVFSNVPALRIIVASRSFSLSIRAFQWIFRLTSLGWFDLTCDYSWACLLFMSPKMIRNLEVAARLTWNSKVTNKHSKSGAYNYNSGFCCDTHYLGPAICCADGSIAIGRKKEHLGTFEKFCENPTWGRMEGESREMKSPNSWVFILWHILGW